MEVDIEMRDPRHPPHPRRGRAAILLTLAMLVLSVVPVRADTGPSITDLSPNAVSSSSESVALVITGSGFDTSWSLRWRGTDYPIAQYFDISADTSLCCVATIPGSALAIVDPFLTVSAFLAKDGAASNALPVTILGPGVEDGASALAGAGSTVSVTTARLSASYTRAAAGSALVTAIDYALPPNPVLPPSPISPIAFVDLQVLSADAADSMVTTFLPPNPILPPSPILPPNPILPPSPIRLAYWTGTAWAPVFGSGSATPTFAFDYATTSATPATVTFDATSTPAITGLGGTIFAFVASYAFEGFADPIESGAVNLVKAGRAVPLKWRVLDLGGNPIPDLDPSTVKLSSASVDCATFSGEETPVDAYAAGASGLQNLGDGYYQWNWATQHGWTGSCRQLRVNLGDAHPSGAPLNHVVEFEFRP